MQKKGARISSRMLVKGVPWDPEMKEPWFLELQKLLINDEKWSCLVTATIQAKTEEEEFVEIYKQSVPKGPRKIHKIISKADVIHCFKRVSSSLLNKLGTKRSRAVPSEQGKKSEKKSKDDKKPEVEKITTVEEEPEEKPEKPKSPLYSNLQEIVYKHGKYNESEYDIHPELMAVLIKYMILKLKEENIKEKKMLATKKRKFKERELKAKFIRDLKPFEPLDGPLRMPKISESKDDEPIDGPDLFITLTDFLDADIYPELIKINVPFLAVIKVGKTQEVEEKKASKELLVHYAEHKKTTLVDEFWSDLESRCDAGEEGFKDIAVIKYDTSGFIKDEDSTEMNRKVIYDEISWMQYGTYRIYDLHKKFIQQFSVQKVSVVVEPFDMSKCDVYNKLCDALLSGQALTPLFMLYAMIEQLVAGVPETETKTPDFKLSGADFFPQKSEMINYTSSVVSSKSTLDLVTPCLQCRDKADYFNRICGPILRKEEWYNVAEDKTIEEVTNQSRSSCSKLTLEKINKPAFSEESKISVKLLDQILSERKSEKEMKKEKKWKNPKLCFYGDLLTMETFHCDSRLIVVDKIIDRFLKNSDLTKIWEKYPVLPPDDEAFYNFHFQRLLKISKDREEKLKMKIFFTQLMKIVGMSKFYFFRGEESNLSEKLSGGWRSRRNLSKVTGPILRKSGTLGGFSSFYFRTFILASDERSRKTLAQIDARKTSASNLAWMLQEESTGHLLHSNITQNPHTFINLASLPFTSPSPFTYEKTNALLGSILDCFDISFLSDFESLKKNEEFQNLIKNFNYYEKLKPSLMIQRLLEPRDDFNTIHCTHFPPTDTLAIMMYNDTDHRGIFFRVLSGSLPTPVALRDFYSHVLPEMKDWLVQDYAESCLLASKHTAKEAAMEEKKNEKYVAQLQQYYCSLDEKGRKEFLEQKIDLSSDLEVNENEMRDLPPKVKLEGFSKTSFSGFDFKDLRIEATTTHSEFYSKDGTQVYVALDKWMYATSEVLTLGIKRSSLFFRYYLTLPESEEDLITFTLRTASNLIFVFQREPDADDYVDYPAKYNVRISWPTGLLVEVKSISNSNKKYVKQSYLQSCRRGWEIEDEKSRCYLPNGEIIIFKETGEIKVLTCHGLIHNVYYGERPRCETVTMTGPVWEQRFGKIRCFNKRKISTNKIYIGVDCKTKETFYKRDDGASCMLWPSGKLVTSYPDGTKITTIPEFDKEVNVEWSDEEKKYFEEIQGKLVEIMEQRSRAILRNSRMKDWSRKLSQSDEFVTVSCTYLMEHPKYSAVYTESKTMLLEVRTLENLVLKTNDGGNYIVEQGEKHLIVRDDIVEFNTQCSTCKGVSLSVINFSSDVLCQTVDFFQNKFVVNRDGSTEFSEHDVDSNPDFGSALETSKNTTVCHKRHTSWPGLEQRCFILERDLSGVEFIHAENLASNELQDDTYFDINTDDLIHTFSTPLTKVGYEKWTMSYEKDDSLPLNLKKKDLKEIDVKENRRKLFEYAFPQNYNTGKRQGNPTKKKIDMPKVNLVRVVNGFSSSPIDIITEVNNYVAKYQKRARDICSEYKKRGLILNAEEDERYTKMRLRKIAVTLDQTLTLYPYLCSQVPSTEKDIHYFGHYINQMEELKSHFYGPSDLPVCKQIPQRLPRKTDFLAIEEETDSSNGD